MSGRWLKTITICSGAATLGLWSASLLVSQAPEPAPKAIADYSAYLRAVELDSLEQFGAVLTEVEAVWSHQPKSPIVGRAALLAARAHLELGKPKEALGLLSRYRSELPQPAGYALFAKCSEFNGEPAASAAYHQRVFYEYPTSAEAAESQAALTRLRSLLGPDFPPALPQAMLSRADRLKKRGEYESIVPMLAGRDRDLAMVRARTGDYDELAELTVNDKDADAERLYLMHTAARRSGRSEATEAAVSELARRHPDSRWRLEALISQGNLHLVENESAKYNPAFTACYQAFPKHPRAPYCHWKVAWNAWIERSPAANALLEEHLKKFPNSDKRSAALYFLGRYAEIEAVAPNSYYATLARRKLTARTPGAARNVSFTPSASLQQRIERARLLDRAGLFEWAEVELRYAAKEESAPWAAALELATMASVRSEHHRAIRFIKSLAPQYLTLPFESAPQRFWATAFPLAYRAPLEAQCKANGLDLHIVAALIRQESEFDPRAVSSARAYGLTQVLPSTGRQLGRRIGLMNVTTSSLMDPNVNLRLGTLYLRSLLDQHDGKWERTLAAYNAGKSRVTRWETWGTYREPAEFIETIPFTETRDYVQIVLRNADIYKRLYASN